MGLFEDERRRRMLSVNPVYIPRNWLLHEAILDAEKEDFEKVRPIFSITFFINQRILPGDLMVF